MSAMTPEDFWNNYTDAMNPVDFILQFHSRNPRRCAEHHVRALGNFLGIVRRRRWKDAFSAECQHLREEVICGITAYLEETRDVWESAVRDADTAASRTIDENAPDPQDLVVEEIAHEEQTAMSDEELEQYYKEEFGSSHAPAQDEAPRPETPPAE